VLAGLGEPLLFLSLFLLGKSLAILRDPHVEVQLCPMYGDRSIFSNEVGPEQILTFLCKESLP